MFFHLLKPRHGCCLAGQTREGQRLLIEQWLQSKVAASTVVQCQDKVSCIWHHVAGAEGAMRLLGIVAGRQGGAVLEEAEEDEKWQDGVSVSDLDRHSFSDVPARS